MEPATILWTFVERCQAARSVEELAGIFLREMSNLGFPYVALSSHVDPLAPPGGAVMILRYPSEWVAQFSAEHYARFDPVFMEATRRALPFHWDEHQFRRSLKPMQLRVLNEASEAGVKGGLSIPIRGPDALPASCSLVPDPGGIDPQAYALAHSMAVFVHEQARRMHAMPIVSDMGALRPRERECLTLVARGKSDWVISELLGVSEKAVTRTVERAKKRLGVATRQQAIVRALFAGEISVYDAMD